MAQHKTQVQILDNSTNLSLDGLSRLANLKQTNNRRPHGDSNNKRVARRHISNRTLLRVLAVSQVGGKRYFDHF